MRRRRSITLPVVAWLLVGLCLGAITAHAAEVDLAEDQRLAKRITISESAISLQDLADRVASTCGLKLEVDPPIREETLALEVAEQPCAVLLEQVRATLGYRWVSASAKGKPDSYRLTEPEGARLARGKLAREYRRECSQELEAQLQLLRQFTRKFRNAAPRDVQDEIQRLEAAVEPLPTGMQRYQAERELRAARQCAEPESGPLILAALALDAAALDRLAAGERLVMATSRPGAIPMPEEVAQALRAARQYQARRTSKLGQKPVASQTSDEVIDFISEVSSRGPTVLYLRSRWLPGQYQRLSFTVPSYLATPSLNAAGIVKNASKPGTVTADRPELLQTPVTFTWPEKKPDPEKPTSYYTGVTVAEALGRLAVSNPQWSCVGDGNLDALATVRTGASPVGGSPFAFETAAMLLNRLSQRGRTGALPLGELLDAVAERGGVNIHVASGGWLRFRSTLYFRNREHQITSETLKQVFGPLIAGGPFTPEVGLLAGALLTQGQVTALGADYLGFPRALLQQGSLRYSVTGWRLVQSLSPTHQKSLIHGAVLSYRSLTRPEQAALLTFLRTLSASPDGAPLDLELGAAELPALQLSLAPFAINGRKLELRLAGVERPLYETSLLAQWKTGDDK